MADVWRLSLAERHCAGSVPQEPGPAQLSGGLLTDLPIHHPMTPKTILGIDPGTKEMGIAVIRGMELLSYGVHTLRNGERPHDVIGQAKRVALSYVERFAPEIVAIEEPILKATKRAAVLSVIAQELRARAEETGLEVIELAPWEIRERLLGDPHANKLQVAEKLVAMGFEDLRAKLPARPNRAVLGFRPGEKYWLHVFDALAMAVVVGILAG